MVMVQLTTTHKLDSSLTAMESHNVEPETISICLEVFLVPLQCLLEHQVAIFRVAGLCWLYVCL
jgi:hypothetical protein